MAFPALAIAAIGIRIVVRQILVLARDHGRNVRYMLVLGAGPRAKAFADLVESHAELGLVIIGHLKADATDKKKADMAAADTHAGERAHHAVGGAEV